MITRNDHNERWYVEFALARWEYSELESLPLAICRAFLLAHGVTEIEVDDERMD